MSLTKIFFNPVGRLRSGWRLLIFIAVLFATYYLLGTVLRVGYAVLFELVPALRPRPYVENFIFRLLTLIAAIIAGYICNRWLEGLPWRALGASFHKGWFRDLVVGSVIGILSLAFASLIGLAAGGLSFSISGRDMLPLVLRTLLASLVMFIVAAFAEEALFRGYPLQTLARPHLAWVGIFITAMLFAAAHLGNPNSTVLGVTNTALAGVWLGVAYLKTRSLWFPLGVHWAWNWALGSLFGLPVSGMRDLAPHPLLRGTDLGPAWLTGGSYGIEGGLACTVAIVVSMIFIWRTRFVCPDAELLQLTSQENPVVREEPPSILRIEDKPDGKGYSEDRLVPTIGH